MERGFAQLLVGDQNFCVFTKRELLLFSHGVVMLVFMRRKSNAPRKKLTLESESVKMLTIVDIFLGKA